jgi:CDP-diglyceride synthetase
LVLHLRPDAQPGRFWFWVIANIAFSLALMGTSAWAVREIFRTKRSSGKTWSAYVAGVAGIASTLFPPGRPAGSRVGNFIAWILLVPIVLLGLLVAVALAMQ